MARYIDLDEALAILGNSLKWSETHLSDANKEYKKGCIAAIKDDISNISHMPIADVVPRAEVEKAKQEVDMEIITEFKELVKQYLLDRFILPVFVKNALAHAETELKKKYIGEQR